MPFSPFMPVEAFKSLLGMSNLHLATFICWNTTVLPLQACFQFPPNNGAALSFFFHKIERVRTRYAFNFSLDPNASHSRWRYFGFVRCSGTCFGLHIAVFWQYLVWWNFKHHILWFQLTMLKQIKLLNIILFSH